MFLKRSILAKGGRVGSALVLAAGLASPVLAETGPGLLVGSSAGTQAVRSEAPANRMLIAASDRDMALLVQRIQDLEQQVRDLTGQVQGLQFQMTQMQTLIERNAADADFRLKALEGGNGTKGAKDGTPGKNDAATQSGGVTPSVESPQVKTAQPGRRQATGDITALPSPAASGANNNGQAGKQAGGNGTSEDGLGGSLDPLVGKGKANAPLASETAPLGEMPAVDLRGAGNAPLNLGYTGTDKPVNPDAAAVYKAGYDAVVRGDYKFARDQFQRFVQLYPDDPKIADATNWLGEAMLRQHDYVDAADTLVNGYKKYPNSARAPDMLLNLAIAFAAAKQPEASCKTFGLLNQRFPNVSPAFSKRISAEMDKVKCSG